MLLPRDEAPIQRLRHLTVFELWNPNSPLRQDLTIETYRQFAHAHGITLPASYTQIQTSWPPEHGIQLDTIYILVQAMTSAPKEADRVQAATTGCVMFGCIAITEEG